MSANAECCGWFSCWPRNSAVSTIKQVQSLSCIVNYKGEIDTESCLVLPPFKLQSGCIPQGLWQDMFVVCLQFELVCTDLCSLNQSKQRKVTTLFSECNDKDKKNQKKSFCDSSEEALNQWSFTGFPFLHQ